MYNKRIFAVLSLVAVLAMLLSACGAAAPTVEEKELTVAGVVFQDDQFMKSMVQGDRKSVV